jgi:hypothetical protein
MLHYYYNNFFYKVLLQKGSLLSVKGLNLKYRLELKFFLNDLQDDEQVSIVEFLEMLETLVGYKAKVFRSQYKYIGTNKKYFFGCKVNVDGRVVFEVLEMLHFIVCPIYVRKYGYLLSEYNGGYYQSFLRDYFNCFNKSTVDLQAPLIIKLGNMNKIDSHWIDFILFSKKD